MVQFSHPYITTEKKKQNIVLTIDKMIPLLFNKLSRFVIAFLPRNKCLLNSRLQSLSAVILETKKIKSDTVFTVFLSISLDDMIFVSEC